MHRRQLVQLSAASVLVPLAASAVAATKPGAAAAADHSHHGHQGHGSRPHQALVDASLTCLSTGEACLAHCLVLLGQGDKEMAACARTVNQMLAACGALHKLAAQGASQLPAFAKVTAAVCDECEKECRKHEKKHAECKACGDACAECAKQCKAVKG